jgi:hypothetical protein
MCSFTYENELDFIKKLRSLKTYCPRAYKDLLFNVELNNLHNLENGRHIRNLYTSKEFKFVYGQIQLIFSVNNGDIVIEDISPQQFLLDGYFNLLDIYKGIPYRNDKDKFKINLFSSMKNRSVIYE